MSSGNDVARPTVTLVPIGVVHSEHVRADETPIQPTFASGCRGTAEVFPEYTDGLKDIEGFSHLILLYHFDRAQPAPLVVKPFLDDTPRGVFATRHPGRPNRIGLSVVRLVRREGNLLFLEDVDILDGTPLLDIKPFLSHFDAPEESRRGWTEQIDPNVAQERGRRGFRRRGTSTTEEGTPPA